jgi:hypothetical protein
LPRQGLLGKLDRYHFRTEHLKQDLQGRSVRGGVATLGAQVCKFGLNLGANLVLARLLTPADYGLAGMVTTITLFVGFLKTWACQWQRCKKKRSPMNKSAKSGEGKVGMAGRG